MTQLNSDPSCHSTSTLKRQSNQSGFFQKDDSRNLLKDSFRSPGSKVLSDANLKKHSPRTSMSQLRLLELGQKQEEGLKRFDMEELRDGFFDPIYNKPINVPAYSKATKHESKLTSLIVRLQGGVKGQWSTKLQILRQKYMNHWVIISKFTVAYFISIVLCLIDKSGNWFGDYRVFLPISVLINHPVHSIGTQVEITLQSIIGLGIGLAWSSLTLYISTATQPTRNHQGGILSSSLFIGLLIMGWFKAYYIRFYYMLLSSGFVLIFMCSCIDIEAATVDWKNSWNIAIPYLFGLLVSLLVSVVYFPYIGTEKVMESLLDVSGSIKALLKTFSMQDDPESGEKITHLQKTMIYKTLMLTESFREFLSGAKLSYYNDEDLKHIRNHLNLIVAPLRVIPPLTSKFSKSNVSMTPSNADTRVQSPANFSESPSGAQTPMPRGKTSFFTNNPNNFTQQFYVSVMDDAFNTVLFKLLAQMIDNLTSIENVITNTAKLTKLQKDNNTDYEELEHSKLLLKKRIYQIDNAYRKFSKTDYFCRDLLSEEPVINMFLFLRYTRQAAVMLVSLADFVHVASTKVGKVRKLYLPNYPLKRALRRLPEQCLKDQGADSVFHYFETKLDVDDAFERIYNLNTSRNKNTTKQDEKHLKTIRAIDHNDFNFHSSSSKLRFKLWMFTKTVGGNQARYALKVSTVIVFLALPAWLKGSWSWYYQYHCFWAPLFVYYFLSPRNAGTWDNLLTRAISWFCGCFWGWAALQARHFKNPFVIAAFAFLICSVFSYGFLVAEHPRSSIISLLSFTIIAINGYVNADESSADIFKNTWITSIAIYISVITSILTNWLVWPFIARAELYKSCSSLLAHIGQSYQSVSERYLYRDVNDDPTDLTLELANIREVRMSQSLLAVRELLAISRREHDFTHRFKPDLFEQLLNSCDIILEKIIEARMSGVYFRVWEQDKDMETTESLLSVRRDSVATVIYVLYIITNSLGSQTALPRYFPSAISVRKRLYDIISQLEVKRDTREDINLEKLHNKLTQLTNTNDPADHDDKSYLKTHWTEVHGMAFSSAFTSITEELEKLIVIAKEIVGEETLME